MKISLIATVKNEESSIKEWIESVFSQSRLPDETIIVDGGSTDNTVKIIDSFIKDGYPIKLLIDKKANISQGRNIAIKNSQYEIIASTDGGCKIDKDWLKKLIKPFEDDSTIDVVSGFYKSDSLTLFEKLSASMILPGGGIKEINLNTFIPSSRSVAFKKQVWEKANGYPEWLYFGEDTLFDLKLKQIGCKFQVVLDAIVYWRPCPNLFKLFKQCYLYGTGYSHIWHSMHVYFYHLRNYSLGLLLLVLSLFYPLLWILLIIGISCYYWNEVRPVSLKLKNIINASKKKIYLFTAIIYLVRDFGDFCGRTVGFLQRIFNSKYKRLQDEYMGKGGNKNNELA